ncbi:MAG: alcohol dehydrogenase [Deltaproteobacteria bacterium]|nr:MAG: alcohol dehydrogenase [Deltaproteobacteria bacterium]
MYAVQLDGKGTAKLVDLNKPVPSKEEVLIKVCYCGICGTDIEILQGKLPWAEYPIVAGHEISGVVVEIGEYVKRLRPGDKVVIDPNLPCHTCVYCLEGKPHLCEDLKAIGVTEPGGFAEYVIAKEEQVLRLPPDIPLDIGALSEPVSCAIHGVEIAKIKLGEKVVIHGAGTIGLIMAQLVRKAGAALIIIDDPLEKRREIARTLGFEYVLPKASSEGVKEIAGDGVDVVIDCSGSIEAISASVDLLRKGGRLVLFGVTPPEKTFSISPYKFYKSELTIMGSFINPYTSIRSIALLSELELRPLITHKYKLCKIGEAFKKHKVKEGIKILIQPELED